MGIRSLTAPLHVTPLQSKYTKPVKSKARSEEV